MPKRRRKRPQPNPLPVVPIVTGMAGFVAGATSAFGLGGGDRNNISTFEISSVEGGILLFGKSDNLLEKAIDVATGKHGYSHVALLLGLHDADNNLLVVESQLGYGVRLITLKSYVGRQVAFVPLEPHDVAHARGAALARLGRPYRGKPTGLTCGEFVRDCLPPRLAQCIRGFPTPNTIATAFQAGPCQALDAAWSPGTLRGLSANPGRSQSAQTRPSVQERHPTVAQALRALRF